MKESLKSLFIILYLLVTADGTWKFRNYVTAQEWIQNLPNDSHLRWYKDNLHQWLMKDSGKKQSSPNIGVMPYSSKFIAWHSLGNSSLDGENLAQDIPVCSQCRVYWEHWKINEILQKQILQTHSISGKASWINPSGFSLIPGALNYWRVINWESAVPDFFLPRTWAGHSETFLPTC